MRTIPRPSDLNQPSIDHLSPISSFSEVVDCSAVDIPGSPKQSARKTTQLSSASRRSHDDNSNSNHSFNIEQKYLDHSSLLSGVDVLFPPLPSQPPISGEGSTQEPLRIHLPHLSTLHGSFEQGQSMTIQMAMLQTTSPSDNLGRPKTDPGAVVQGSPSNQLHGPSRLGSQTLSQPSPLTSSLPTSPVLTSSSVIEVSELVRGDFAKSTQFSVLEDYMLLHLYENGVPLAQVNSLLYGGAQPEAKLRARVTRLTSMDRSDIYTVIRDHIADPNSLNQLRLHRGLKQTSVRAVPCKPGACLNWQEVVQKAPVLAPYFDLRFVQVLAEQARNKEALTHLNPVKNDWSKDSAYRTPQTQRLVKPYRPTQDDQKYLKTVKDLVVEIARLRLRETELKRLILAEKEKQNLVEN